MVSKITTFAIHGISAIKVEVQVHLSGKSPQIMFIGLPDAAIKEAQYRIKIGLRNTGYSLPDRRIIIHLAPANIKKQGSQYDLPMTIGILTATKEIDPELINKVAFVGEIGLDGSILPVSGIIAMVEAAFRLGFTKMILPRANALEAACCEKVKIYPVSHLRDVIRIINNWDEVQPFEEKLPVLDKHQIDYKEVVGQEYSKRAMLIAAAGRHHCLMIGSPGSGKTMLAQRLPTILPPLTLEESMETTRIYSIAGLLTKYSGRIIIPPFRSPHHTISSAGMAGGGSNPRPGELSLANHGILFLDELAEFPKRALEVLRQPFESGVVTIARAKDTVTYPAHFLLIAAMNPCPCGYYNDPVKSCSCSSQAVHAYRHKISGPLMDRFDLQIQVERIHFDDIMLHTPKGVDSYTMKQQVIKTREIQLKRWASYGFTSNSAIPARLLIEHCALDDKTEQIFKKAMEQRCLSARAVHKILRVARTIADLDCSNHIQMQHMIEALQYRTLDTDNVNFLSQQ